MLTEPRVVKLKRALVPDAWSGDAPLLTIHSKSTRPLPFISLSKRLFFNAAVTHPDWSEELTTSQLVLEIEATADYRMIYSGSNSQLVRGGPRGFPQSLSS
jgi:hypothetical protein